MFLAISSLYFLDFHQEYV